MSDSKKVTVLLADEDALRRDGLASVLKANGGIEIVAGCPDGQTALDEIRELRPDVAVVDLNLPTVHGIELVRRVRAEGLGTKIVILSGTMDDEIVREVVRAGADAYLLKNGPARHLTDAINYVRDGGQYFSPQLRRDGRDRHLLEEPRRNPADYGHREEREEDREASLPGTFRDADGRIRAERRSRARTADPKRFRERIREEASRELQDRDYDIMTEMADGIRPILDRLDEIEDRIVEMESGDEPIPADPRGWLSAQLSDTLKGSRGATERSSGRGMSSRDVEERLPQLIEEAVTKRFQSLAGKLQEEIEEQHVKTLETFVKNIQVKLVQRVSALEQNMQTQAEAMLQLREYNQRTEDNLSRLITGVDKLAHELPKRIAAAQTESAAETAQRPADKEANARVSGGKESRAPRIPVAKKKLVPIIFWAVVLIGVIFAIIYGINSRDADSASKVPAGGNEVESSKEKAPATSKAAPPVSDADTKTKLEAAKQYMERKEYATAEDIYKQVVNAEPNNVEALTGLASVLYREDKIEESAAVLDRLPKK